MKQSSEEHVKAIVRDVPVFNLQYRNVPTADSKNSENIVVCACAIVLKVEDQRLELRKLELLEGFHREGHRGDLQGFEIRRCLEESLPFGGGELGAADGEVLEGWEIDGGEEMPGD